MERLPRPLLSRRGQVLIDATLSAAAIWLSYQLRFDFEVPSSHRVVMWTRALLLAFLTPLCLMWRGAYRSTWRYFNFKDAQSFAVGALPAAGLMLLIRVGSVEVFGIKVPLIVIVADYTIFLIFGLTVRAIRRLLYEISLSKGNLRRTAVVGTEEQLASALRQVNLSPEVFVTGLFAADPELRGRRINGYTVLGTPEELGKHLTSGEVDLVLVADSDVDSIGRTTAAWFLSS